MNSRKSAEYTATFRHVRAEVTGIISGPPCYHGTIDVRGEAFLARSVSPDSVLIFILPHGGGAWSDLLTARGTETSNR